jgi:phosphoserine phosphatase
VRLKHDLPALVEFLGREVSDCRFSFYVISAAPREIVEAALEGIVAPENILATEFDWDPVSGEVRWVRRVAAGYGKVKAIEELETRLGTDPSRTIYVGDGSSDVHVMLHVNRRNGFTIAASENRMLRGIAKRTVVSDNAMGIAVPVLEQIVGSNPDEIRDVFRSFQLTLQQWERERADRITVEAVA